MWGRYPLTDWHLHIQWHINVKYCCSVLCRLKTWCEHDNLKMRALSHNIWQIDIYTPKNERTVHILSSKIIMYDYWEKDNNLTIISKPGRSIEDDMVILITFQFVIIICFRTKCFGPDYQEKFLSVYISQYPGEYPGGISWHIFSVSTLVIVLRS